MPNDRYSDFRDSPIFPASRCFTLTPDDAAVLPLVTKAVYAGSGGDIVLRSLEGDADVVFRNVPAGAILDVRVTAIRATGTTASDLVGLA
ncbi:MAG: hypothetical protein ACK5NN_08470 [Sphingomonadaceae bacterium]